MKHPLTLYAVCTRTEESDLPVPCLVTDRTTREMFPEGPFFWSRAEAEAAIEHALTHPYVALERDDLSVQPWRIPAPGLRPHLLAMLVK